MLATALLFSAALLPLPVTGYIDRVVAPSADGDVILRTSEHSDFNGGKIRLEQKLRRLSGDRFSIDFSDQPAFTKIYHEALCLEGGMRPSTERGVLGGEDAIAAWSCVSSETREGTPATIEEIERVVDEPASSQENWTDYARTAAPSGSAALGQPFFAVGSMSVKSSVAGAVSYSVSVDDRRCYFQSAERHAGAFELSAQTGVSCSGDRPGSLNTETRACVPRACGLSQGSYRIR
ncbi:hypothetical protein ABRP17_004355 [Stenotrophomonas sp. WHRI 8082]|uniref:hypothetical protein n=1 Tax=Stenotrophomonas sp. WHRI 8082 TaxID=3162571 RepID=UPI0032EAB756